MSPKKYRWSKVYESAEEELQDFLAARNIVAQRHDLESYNEQQIHTNENVRLWGVEGTASMIISGKRYSIQPGDVIELPAGSECTLTTSLSNFAWYQ